MLPRVCSLYLPLCTGSSAGAGRKQRRRRRISCVAVFALDCDGSAHDCAPDDEDGALLTWLSRQQGVRTGLLTLNRGEGGANLIGPELYDALGILRTEELLAAGRYYDVYQMFT